MRRRKILSFIIPPMLAGVVAMSGCAVGHETMRGSVVMKFEDEAHICIGNQDGISVGETLNVYRVKVDNSYWLYDYQRKFPTSRSKPTKYEWLKVGQVKVIRLFDDHFAAVQLVSGELESSDIVEKVRPR